MLRLGRADTPDALEQLRQYSPAEVATALKDLEPARRHEFLEMAERVEEIVPLLPEAEFTSTVRGAGIEESGWLVEFASSEQRVAAVDLDCWQDFRFSPSRLFEWIDAMIEAGPETLAASFDELDPEVWVLAMKAMGDFSVFGFGEDDTPEGSTIDGVVFYSAHTAEGEDRIQEILGTALHYAPSHYWPLVYGAIFESEAESEQFAARWQRGRLADLGFPEREQAMRAYAPLAVDEATVLDLARSDAPVPSASQVPQQIGGSLVGRALLELPGDRADEVMGSVLAVANALAVADELPLAERETVERSLAKALRGIERGLAEAVRARSQSPGTVLDATPALDLFRIGATLDAELRPRKTRADLREDEQRADWNVETEMISEADQTLGGDGFLND